MALVVLLRGVNVGGHRTFRPTQLVRELKHFEPLNIGAAGTFVIRARVTQAQIRAAFAEQLPFETEIMIVQGREFLKLLSRDDFAECPASSDVVRFVSVLSRSPRAEPALPMSLPADAPWLVRILAREGRLVLGVYQRNMRAIGALGTLERLFGAKATTRSWNTIDAIARALLAT